MSIGKLLRNARIKKGLSQKDVALRLGLSTSQYISNIEREVCPPSVDALVEMASFYNIPKRDVIDLMIQRYKTIIELKFSKIKENSKKTRKRA